MTLCKYYARGYCKFGDNCRFEHINNNRYKYTSSANNQYEYASNARYNQNRDQLSQTPKVGFSFTKTLQNLPNTDRSLSRTVITNPNTDIKRTIFQTPKTFQNSNNLYSIRNNSPSVDFSFSRTLNTIKSSNVRPTQHMLTPIDDIDIEMDSSHNRQQTNITTNNFISHPISNTSKESETQKITFNSDIYSKINDLTEQEIKSYENNKFIFRNIPIHAPPKHFC